MKSQVSSEQRDQAWSFYAFYDSYRKQHFWMLILKLFCILYWFYIVVCCCSRFPNAFILIFDTNGKQSLRKYSTSRRPSKRCVKNKNKCIWKSWTTTNNFIENFIDCLTSFFQVAVFGKECYGTYKQNYSCKQGFGFEGSRKFGNIIGKNAKWL